MNYKDRLKELQHYYLGQKVNTPNGEGIIVKLNMDYNGLYLMPETANCVVWFTKSTTWQSYTFIFDEISPILKEERKEKLKNIINII